eukprot:7391737-Prymnesium_polylepis.2
MAWRPFCFRLSWADEEAFHGRPTRCTRRALPSVNRMVYCRQLSRMLCMSVGVRCQSRASILYLNSTIYLHAASRRRGCGPAVHMSCVSGSVRGIIIFCPTEYSGQCCRRSCTRSRSQQATCAILVVIPTHSTSTTLFLSSHSTYSRPTSHVSWTHTTSHMHELGSRVRSGPRPSTRTKSRTTHGERASQAGSGGGGGKTVGRSLLVGSVPPARDSSGWASGSKAVAPVL